MKFSGRQRNYRLYRVSDSQLCADRSLGMAWLHSFVAFSFILGLDIAAAQSLSLLPEDSSYFTPSDSGLQNNGSAYSFESSGKTMRFEVRSGDRPRFDSSSVERSEISSGKEIQFGKTYTLRYKFMVEPGIALTSRWMILGQVHHRNDSGERGGSPPFGVEVNGEIMRVVARSSTDEIRTSNISAKTLWKDDAPLQRGRWYDVRFELKFDPFGDGLVNLWIDGQRELQYQGPLGYNDKRGGYLKIGIYRSASPEPVAVQYAEISVTEGTAFTQIGTKGDRRDGQSSNHPSVGSP
jgi:hypothetical protein